MRRSTLSLVWILAFAACAKGSGFPFDLGDGEQKGKSSEGGPIPDGPGAAEGPSATSGAGSGAPVGPGVGGASDVGSGGGSVAIAGVGGAGGACAHPECSEGGPLDAACSTCAGEVCASDSFCCATEWDTQCVNEVADACGMPCGGGTGGAPASSSSMVSASSAASSGPSSSSAASGGGSTCAHDTCTEGDSLVTGCDPCVDAVCGSDPYCCNVSWDSVCVGEVGDVCGTPCGSGAGGGGSGAGGAGGLPP